jgi:pimeloyl-ACP methyl ester carboxylesterase
LKNLQDTEKIVDNFFDTCFLVGSERCELRRSTDTSPNDIRQRVYDLRARLDENPIGDAYGGSAVTITGQDVDEVFSIMLYNPLEGFEVAAMILDRAINGSENFLTTTSNWLRVIRPENACNDPGNNTIISAAFRLSDADRAVLCGDGDDSSGLGFGKFEEYVKTLKNQSLNFGRFFAPLRFACSGYKIRASWRFTGPFTTPAHDPRLVEGRPAAPLLFTSSTLDPVTPLANAVAMSAAHPGSSVLIQNTMGHGSVLSRSNCTQKFVQAYLDTGVVPISGTVCEPACQPWDVRNCNPTYMALPGFNGIKARGLVEEAISGKYSGLLSVPFKVF